MSTVLSLFTDSGPSVTAEIIEKPKQNIHKNVVANLTIPNTLIAKSKKYSCMGC